MRRFVQTDRRHIAVEVDSRCEGIEMVAAKQSPRQNRFSGHRQHAQCVSVRPADRFVLSQTPPIVDRGILVQPHFDMVQVVFSDVLGDHRFGLF